MLTMDCRVPGSSPAFVASQCICMKLFALFKKCFLSHMHLHSITDLPSYSSSLTFAITGIWSVYQKKLHSLTNTFTTVYDVCVCVLPHLKLLHLWKASLHSTPLDLTSCFFLHMCRLRHVSAALTALDALFNCLGAWPGCWRRISGNGSQLDLMTVLVRSNITGDCVS